MDETPAPVPRAKGRFSLFDLPDGGLMVAYRLDEEDEDRHMQIPGMVIRMAKLHAEGKLNPMELVKALG